MKRAFERLVHCIAFAYYITNGNFVTNILYTVILILIERLVHPVQIRVNVYVDNFIVEIICNQAVLFPPDQVAFPHEINMI